MADRQGDGEREREGEQERDLGCPGHHTCLTYGRHLVAAGDDIKLSLGT